MSDARTAGAARDADLEIDTLLQQAFEFAYQRRLLAKLTTHNARRSAADAAAGRKAVQAAFCIDVRSEVFRRSLETVTPEVETIGFAGFFGFPIEYIPIGYSHGGAQCPVLLTPTFRVREALLGATPAEESRVIAQRTLRRRVRSAWKSFRTSAISCFSYVETAGLLFAFKLFTDSFGLTRTVTHPSAEGLDADVLRRLGPQIERHLHHHAHHGHDAHAAQSTGFAPDERVAMAEAVLRAMSMTGNFARLVLLAGHGSTTINNPHATSLDCGACGGHTGEANARVAAAILNDSAVRAGLAARGIMVPADAWFLAGLHDTTTDDVRIYDADKVPATLASDLERLRRWLAQAKQLTHVQRATLLGIGNRSQAGIDANIEQRSRDWSQVRPEWGLAGNAAFIAAPRSRTQGRDLGGRAFLHNYDWRADSNWSVLELIMTAPMVVASWINLQYYGSTVNNAVFGSGNKVLHNVVGGTLGVLQGNGGDLQVGLPLQSVHDGKRFVHEPLRLNVFIEAPQDAIDGVIARHQSVRQLLDNGWIHLFRIADGGRHHHRYLGKLQWEAVR